MENTGCIKAILQTVSDLQKLTVTEDSKNFFLSRVPLTTLIEELNEYEPATLIKNVIDCTKKGYINSNIDVNNLHTATPIESIEIYGLTMQGEKMRSN